MDLNDFLEADQNMALQETICITNCLFMMRSELIKGDFMRARLAAENVVRSFKSLEEMQKRKKHQNELQALLEEMQRKGISVAILKRRGKI